MMSTSTDNSAAFICGMIPQLTNGNEGEVCNSLLNRLNNLILTSPEKHPRARPNPVSCNTNDENFSCQQKNHNSISCS